MSIDDATIVAAREAIYRRQRSLVAKITKSSIRDALAAAYPMIVASAEAAGSMLLDVQQDCVKAEATLNRVLALAEMWEGYDETLYDVAVHRECAEAIRTALADTEA